jgi:hypothetical protein
MRIAKGGAIAFGDYDTAQQATDCMLNLHNLKFPGWTGEGLKISYDKGGTGAQGGYAGMHAHSLRTAL